MNSPTIAIGDKNAPSVHISACPRPILRSKPKNLQDLLAAMDVPGSDLPIGMLKTTASHVSIFFNLPLHLIPVNKLEGLGPEFRNYLKEHRYKRNAIRSYSNFLSILIRSAKQLGWESSRHLISEKWENINAALAKFRMGFGSIVEYAIQHGKTPLQLSDGDLTDCCRTLLDRGLSYQRVRALPANFRCALFKLGLLKEFPRLSLTHKKPHYRVPLRLFPTSLRVEVESLLQWKQVPYAEGRPRKGRHRAISAACLEACIASLYGFMVNVEERKNVTTLAELVTKPSLDKFIKWMLNDRRTQGDGLVHQLGILHAALRWNPAYKGQDFSWLPVLLSQIPLSSESERRERKESKYLPFEQVADIPRMIQQTRKEVASSKPKKLALLVHDELLMSCLVTLVWRQRNLRECKIGHNLFKAELPAHVSIARPKWVEERLVANPNETFWQFYFREDETKMHHEVRAILPRRLVPLLEDYLGNYRPLLTDADHGCLFVNRNGGPLARNTVNALVSNLTMRYKHRRISPHLIRDIFAYWWLNHHPEDFLTLSKMLWHRDVKTTLRNYSGRFDESHGLRRVEEWIASYGQRRECDSGDGAENAERLSDIGKSEAIPKAVTEAVGTGGSNKNDPTLDYKARYLTQRETNKGLVDRIRRLEKQLADGRVARSADSQFQLKIEPRSPKARYWRTG